MPGARHGTAQLYLGGVLNAAFGLGAQGQQPGGWWLMAEVEVELAKNQVVRPDLVGWRMERMPELPDGFPVKLCPDWICEIVSPSDPRRDTVIKYRDYARAGVPHYWLVDLEQRTLTTLELRGEHYVVGVEADATQSVRAAPFELVEITVGPLFGQRAR
jgi:Uma2 family endonuclease